MTSDPNSRLLTLFKNFSLYLLQSGFPTLASTRFYSNRPSFSHKEVMDMEINFFLKNFTRENPELLMDHIQRMSSGEADFFPSTLSSLYGKLAKNNFPRSVTSGSVLREFTETDLAFQLACSRCTERARLRHLFDGLRCPRCPPMGWGRPFMQCPLCKTPRTRPSNTCLRPTCPMKFV